MHCRNSDWTLGENREHAGKTLKSFEKPHAVKPFPIKEFEGRARLEQKTSTRARRYSDQRRNKSEPLVPPKPKEFESAYSTCAFRAWFGM